VSQIIYTPGKLVLAKDYTEGDRYFSNVSLLLHGNGTNGSTTIIDNSPTPKTVTAVGNAQISTAQSKFGGASILFDGNGDYLTTVDDAGFRFGTSDFTVEAWVYQVARSTYLANIVGNGFYDQVKDNGWNMDILSTGIARFYTSGSGQTPEIVSSGTTVVPLNTWTHFAAVRSGSTLTLYLDGAAEGSISSTQNENWTGANAILRVGTVGIYQGLGLSQYSLNGYIDDLRITKGVARYTANFIPPTAAFADAQY
jgi:hypothetical protein